MQDQMLRMFFIPEMTDLFGPPVHGFLQYLLYGVCVKTQCHAGWKRFAGRYTRVQRSQLD